MSEQKKPAADGKILGFSVMSAGNALNALLAYFRFAQITAIFGADWKTDALAVAMVFPQLLRDVVAHSFGSAFIPIYSRVIQDRGHEQGIIFINRVIGWIILAGVILIAGLWYFSAFLVHLISPSGTPELLGLASLLLRIVLPIVILSPLRGILANFIKYEKRFRILPMTGVINLSVSFGLILIVRDAFSVNILPLSMIAGGIAELAFLFIHSRKSGFKVIPGLARDAFVGQLARMSLPVVFGTTVGFLAPLADKMLASFLPESSVTAIDYANRIKGIVLSVAFGPFLVFADLDFSVEAAKGKLDSLLSSLRNSINHCSIVMFPVSALVCVLAVPLVSVLLQRGNFTARNAGYVGYALSFYAPWLAQFGIGSIVSRAFYAQKDSFTPVLIGVFGMITNVLLNVILVVPLGIGGLALATTLASSSKTLYLIWSLSGKMNGLGLRKIRNEQLKMLAATFLAVGAVLGLLALIPFSTSASLPVRFGRLVLYVTAGTGVYAAFLMVMKCRTALDLFAKLRNRTFAVIKRMPF